MRLYLFLLILLLVPCVFAQGIGVSPSNLELNLLRDGENNAHFIIFNPSNHAIDFNIHNDDFSDWFEFEPSSGSMSAGSKQEIKVKVSVDPLVANGIYNSLIIIDVGAHNPEQSLALNIGTAIKTKIRVTGKQIINLAVSEVKVNCRNLDEPVLFEFNAINNGNVEVLPIAEITIKRDDFIIDKYELDLTTIAPGKQEEYKIAWNKGVVGMYKAQVLVKVDDELIKKSVNEFTIDNNYDNSTQTLFSNEETKEKEPNHHLIGMLLMVSIVFIGFLSFLFISSK